MNIARPTDAPLYRAHPDIVACPLGEAGVALLDPRSNTYFSLDPVGEAVWATLSSDGAAPASLDGLSEAVARDFDVSPDRCRDDIDRLLSDLRRHELVSVAPAAGPADASA